MGIYVTETGLRRKTLQEIRAELEQAFKNVFGASFETSVDSPNGLLISQLSTTIASHWELAQEVFNSRDPAQAIGVALDYAATLSGVTRRQETSCKVTAVLYTEGTTATIPAGSIAEMPRGSRRFTLDMQVAISRSSCSELVIDMSGFTGSTYTLQFTFGTVTYDEDTSLVDAIEAAGGIAEESALGIRVTHSSGTVGLLSPVPTGFVVMAGEPGNFIAAIAGEQTCEAGELTVIPVAVTGWDQVYNYEAGIPGAPVEGDTALRVRRALASRSIRGRGTDPAIEAHLQEEVAGVTHAKVTSNRTMSTDSQGRPPKSFEALVVGGDPEDIARVIWQNMPSGIECWGNTSQAITDEDGDEQMIFFSRPVPMYLWVELTYHLYDEESAPSAADIKAAIVAWAEKEYTLGKDVIPDRVLTAVYPPNLDGIGQASVRVSLKASEADSPTWTSSVIPVAPGQYAVPSVARVTLVEDT